MTITAAWNVKNEEAFIGYSIMSVKNIADEFIVVDHGSIDNTPHIIKKCEELLGKPIKIIHYPPEKPEPETKNLKYKEATKDWVLWLDGDELFTYKEADLIPKAIEDAEKQNKIGIYLFMIEFVHNFNTTCRKLIVPEIGGGGQGHRPRVLKRGMNIYVNGNWRRSQLMIDGKIHQEQFDKMLHTKILIYHYDRLKTSPQERYDKVLLHLTKVTRWKPQICKACVDDPGNHYYNLARNLDNAFNFTGEQPEVFKEYSELYDLTTLKGLKK